MLEVVLLLDFLSFLRGDTLIALRVIIHVLLAQISFETDKDLWAVCWPQRQKLIPPLSVGTLQALTIHK